MADVTRNWGQITSGTEDLYLEGYTGGGYALGTSDTGAGVDEVTAYWSEIANGTYPLKLVDNGSAYLIGVHE